jgi:hypothetical protein
VDAQTGFLEDDLVTQASAFCYQAGHSCINPFLLVFALKLQELSAVFG